MAAAAAAMLADTIDRPLRTRYRQLPVQLRMSGLAATYAYLLGKSNATELGQAYHQVADGIRIHLTTGSGLVDAAEADTNEKLLHALATLDASAYARASAEVQALAGWLSRLAEARFIAAASANEDTPDGDAV
ncbi:hypothetical protein GCM10009541_55830 [Micromonospora gifhornensis]|uniref:CRISPR type III-B/RAMP module-associated protein Cmr5 n=2 Tax=Micromonospora gifhornensis TaxID=84594 RepID=A0ABQ4IMP7_9ACTN|nr:hypothetical protein Vgi01_58650 [Micromonospora gifhornensis]